MKCHNSDWNRLIGLDRGSEWSQTLLYLNTVFVQCSSLTTRGVYPCNIVWGEWNRWKAWPNSYWNEQIKYNFAWVINWHYTTMCWSKFANCAIPEKKIFSVEIIEIKIVGTTDFRVTVAMLFSQTYMNFSILSLFRDLDMAHLTFGMTTSDECRPHTIISGTWTYS